VNKNSNSIQDGDLNGETTETLPVSQSSNEESRSTSDTSDTTQSRKPSQKDSQPTPNLRDAPNAARLIQALGAKLGKLVEWKKLTLGDGREVYALIFPTDKWHVDPVSKELLPR
jgi:hypothetical protein